MKLFAIDLKKLYFALFLISLSLFVSCSGCGSNSSSVIPLKGISLNRKYIKMNLGSQITLVAEVEPVNAPHGHIIWSSSDKSAATVDEKGTVVALGSGRAVITAKTSEGGKVAKCTVQVHVPVERIRLNRAILSLKMGESAPLVKYLFPRDASDKRVTWTSDSELIAAVSPHGTVTAISPGKTFISVKTEDGNKIAKCRVIVKRRSDSRE